MNFKKKELLISESLDFLNKKKSKILKKIMKNENVYLSFMMFLNEINEGKK